MVSVAAGGGSDEIPRRQRSHCSYGKIELARIRSAATRTTGGSAPNVIFPVSGAVLVCETSAACGVAQREAGGQICNRDIGVAREIEENRLTRAGVHKSFARFENNFDIDGI